MQNPHRLGSDQVLLYKREVPNLVLSAVVMEIRRNQCWESPVKENGWHMWSQRQWMAGLVFLGTEGCGEGGWGERVIELHIGCL